VDEGAAARDPDALTPEMEAALFPPTPRMVSVIF